MDVQTQDQSGKNHQMRVGMAVVGLLVIAFIGVMIYQSQQQTTSSQTNTSAVAEQSTQSPTTAAQQAASYNDGTYAVVGNYTSPGGQEELGVTITLTNGVISDVTVEPKATRPISKTRQADFAANYKQKVVGKNIDTLRLGKVSGSSLSPKGFNDALDKVKQKAQS